MKRLITCLLALLFFVVFAVNAWALEALIESVAKGCEKGQQTTLCTIVPKPVIPSFHDTNIPLQSKAHSVGIFMGESKHLGGPYHAHFFD